MWNELLERKVDANKNNAIETKELLDFIWTQKNIEELWTYLNAMPFKDRGDTLYRTTQEEIDSHMSSIASKVKNNQSLTLDEKNIMKIQYFMDEGKYLKDESEINFYLGSKFRNQWYGKTLFSMEKKPISIVKEISKPNWNDSLEIISCREGFEKGAVDKLIAWIKEYDFIWYEKARISAETRHINKESKYIKDYVNYDLVNYAFQKYSDSINKKDKELQRQAWYIDDADFTKQIGKIWEMWKAVEAYKKEKFPNIDTTINQFMSYTSDVSDSAKKYGYKTPQDQEKATENYKEFIKEVSKISKDQNTQEMMQKLQNPKISSWEQLQEYFLITNKLFEYTTTYQTLKNKYWVNAIDTYEKYMGTIKDITQRYWQENIINWSKEIENYSNSLQWFKKWFDPDINRDKYKKYDAMVQKEWLVPYKQSMSKLSNSISNPTDANSPFFGLKIQAQEKKLVQANTDGIRNTIKNIDPIGYQALNFWASAWNGLVDFIVWTWSSLWLMLQKSWKTDDERSASADFKEQFDSFLKFNLSTEQSKPPLDEDGNFDLWIDNTVSQVWSQLANMLALLSGAWWIGKGVAKLWVSAVISQRVWLVSMAFIQNVGRSFQEGIGQWLDNGQAVGYAMLQSIISSWLELISPNDMIMWTGKSVAKDYIKNLVKTETKESLIQVWKLFGKNIGKEVAEENMQEALQLAVGNWINLRANDKWNAKFNANFSIDNFAATAVLTTLTTGVASSKQWLKQANYDMGPLSLDQQNQIKQEIIKNPSLYQNITQIIDQIKLNKTNIEGVDIQSILQLESELNNLKEWKIDFKINFKIKKSFAALTLKDRQDMWWINEWKSYIQKNELWKDESLSFDKEGNKNIDISKKQSFEDLTLAEFSTLLENIQAKKANIKSKQTTPESSKNQLNISSEIQKQNSLNSDNLINPDKTINPDAQFSVEQFLREQNALWKDQTLSEEQIIKIYEVHTMQKKQWETDDISLNIRKWLALKSLFTAKQIRALLEGKVCWVTEKVDRQTLTIEKKDTENLLPNQFKEYMLATQKRLLETKMHNNPDIQKTDNVIFEENITLINHNDLSLVNPPKQIIKIEIHTTLDKFVDQYTQAIKDKIWDLWSETAYSIFDFNQDIFFQAPWAKEAKNESWYINYISNGKMVYWAEEINNNKTTFKLHKNKSQVDTKIVEANAKLPDTDRIAKAKELLWDILPIQEQAILDAHNQPGEINNLDFSQIRARLEILQKAGFTSEQIRILMENGICGKNTRERIIHILEPIKNFLARGEVDLALSYVEKISPSMEYVTTEAPKKLVDVPRAFLDGYLKSKGVAEPSDLMFFLWDIKKLKDSMVCGIQLYTENLWKINKLEETIDNARLPDDKRIDKWLQIIEGNLDIKLSSAQKEAIQKAIISAHNYGSSELWKNWDPASIYNYTIKQLWNKMYILMDAMQKSGIEYNQSKDIAKELLRKGICGEVAAEVKKENIENNIKEEVKDTKAKKEKKEEIHSEVVKNTYDEIIKNITLDIEKWNNVEKNKYMIASMENLAKTSRTAQWILDASASENKKFKFEEISPEQWWVKALENFRKISEYLYENRSKQFTSPKELQKFIETIAKDVNAGILKPEYFIRDENPSLDANGKPKYAYTEVTDLNIAFKDFCNSFLEKLNNPNTDPIELAAWVEYRVNIKDHFFADWCGKISIALSNFVLMRYGKELPDIRSKDERFEFTGKTQRNAKDPNNEPDLENRTNYYKTLFTMKEINKFSNIRDIQDYIDKQNSNSSLPTWKEIILWSKDKKYIIITKEGKMKIQTIENYVMDKINGTKNMQEIDNFIKNYNNTNPPKSKEIIMGMGDEYCIVRNSENGIIEKIQINKNTTEIDVDFIKMNTDEILKYSIENADMVVEKYQKVQKTWEEYVIDVDWFRQFLGGTKKGDTQEWISPQTNHEWASFLGDYYFDKILKNNKNLEWKSITIRFIWWWPWSGKSMASDFVTNDVFSGVWDGTMKTYENAVVKIEQAKKLWYNVQLDFVFREMNEAWNNWVLKRVVEQNLWVSISSIQDLINGKYNDQMWNINYIWRTVPMSVFEKWHIWSRETFTKLYYENEWYKWKIGDINFIYKDKWISWALLFEEFIQKHQNDIFDKNIAKQNTELLLQKWFISQTQYDILVWKK